MIFKTKRLFIQLLEISDLEDFHSLQSDPQVMKYVSEKEMTYRESKSDLSNIISNYELPENHFLILGVKLFDNTFIGTCALVKNELKEYEIGYRIIKKYWGNGYGKEIVKGLIEYAFDIKKIEKIYAYVAVENKASVKILDTYFDLESESWNEKENCLERKYYATNKMP